MIVDSQANIKLTKIQAANICCFLKLDVCAYQIGKLFKFCQIFVSPAAEHDGLRCLHGLILAPGLVCPVVRTRTGVWVCISLELPVKMSCVGSEIQ